jgi:aconitate hydratase
VLAENLVRRCDPATLADSLMQIIERRRDLDFPWFPARVVCHDILGQTALVDLAGLRDAIAEMGGDPAKVNPVVPVQLVVDHSLAVEYGGFDKDALQKNRAVEDRRNEDRFHFIDWTRKAFKNVDVIPPGNGIMHQINLERMSPVIHAKDGVAFPDTLVGTDSHTPHVDALGVIAIGVGGLEAENVMLGVPRGCVCPISSAGAEGWPPGITATTRRADRFLRRKSRRRVSRVLWRRRCALTLGSRNHIQHGTEWRDAAMFSSTGKRSTIWLTGREEQVRSRRMRKTGLWASIKTAESVLKFGPPSGAHGGSPTRTSATDLAAEGIAGKWEDKPVRCPMVR